MNEIGGGASITLVTDNGYTLTGRVKNVRLHSEPHYDSVYSDDWSYPISTYLNDERIWLEADFDTSEGHAYVVEQNFVEVVKSLAVKGNHSKKDDAFAYTVGVPAHAIYTVKYSAKTNETTFKWTERVNVK